VQGKGGGKGENNHLSFLSERRPNPKIPPVSPGVGGRAEYNQNRAEKKRKAETIERLCAKLRQGETMADTGGTKQTLYGRRESGRREGGCKLPD